MKNFSPNHPFEYQFFDEIFAMTYQTEQKTEKQFSVITILSILIACMGLFHFRYWIHTTGMPGMASRNASNRQPTAAKGAMCFDSRLRITGTTGIKATMRAH